MRFEGSDRGSVDKIFVPSKRLISNLYDEITQSQRLSQQVSARHTSVATAARCSFLHELRKEALSKTSEVGLDGWLDIKTDMNFTRKFAA